MKKKLEDFTLAETYSFNVHLSSNARQPGLPCGEQSSGQGPLSVRRASTSPRAPVGPSSARQGRPAHPAAAEAVGEASGEVVGLEIRDLRRARQITLKDLAVATKLSVGHLSEVERGLASPSVKALHDIAAALGVNISWFFQGADAAAPGERDVVVRAGNRRTLTFSSGITDELLSPNLRGSLELLLSRFAPGSSSGEDPYTHRGEEAGVLIQGQLELWVGRHEYLLHAGDSFSFPSAQPHRYSNPGDVEAVVIWAITPPSY